MERVDELVNTARKRHLRLITNVGTEQFQDCLPRIDGIMNKISKVDIIKKLASVAPGWSADVEKTFLIPEDLYMQEQLPYLYLCSEPDVNHLINVLQSFMRAEELPVKLPKYGIAINETAGSVYATFVDMNRKIAVRQQINSLHETNPEGWPRLARAIKED